MESGVPNFILSQIFKLFKTTSFSNGLSYFHLIPFHTIDRAARAAPISLLNTIKGLSMRSLGFLSPLVMPKPLLLCLPIDDFSEHLCSLHIWITMDNTCCSDLHVLQAPLYVFPASMFSSQLPWHA